MHQKPYVFREIHSHRYYFYSLGKGVIKKIVDFSPTTWNNEHNLGFGDLMPDGRIDHAANSNNGDIIKIFSTIIDIVQHFINKYPSTTVSFSGNTTQRTKIYNRILRTCYPLFCKNFLITAYYETESGIEEEIFDPTSTNGYVTFFVKKIN